MYDDKKKKKEKKPIFSLKKKDTSNRAIEVDKDIVTKETTNIGAKSAEVKSAEVKSAEVKSAEVKSAEVKSAEVKSAEVKSEFASSDSVKNEINDNEIKSSDSSEMNVFNSDRDETVQIKRKDLNQFFLMILMGLIGFIAPFFSVFVATFIGITDQSLFNGTMLFLLSILSILFLFIKGLSSIFNRAPKLFFLALPLIIISVISLIYNLLIFITLTPI